MTKNRWKTKELQYIHYGYHASRWAREDYPSNIKIVFVWKEIPQILGEDFENWPPGT